MSRHQYLLVAAGAGAAVLALEVLAARITTPALGSGPVSWAALLATALGMLAAGNILGGHFSGRATASAAIAWGMAIAAAYLVILSQSYGPALRWAAGQPLFLGEILGAAIVQAVPMLALGAITPVILHHGRDGTGRWGATVLAACSGGGIAGALATGILLIPTWGIARSLLLLAALLALTAVPAAWQARSRFATVLLLGSLAAVVWCWAQQRQSRVVESLYGQLEVRASRVATVLTVDGLPQTGLPKQLGPGDALQYGYLLELPLTMRPRIKTALVAGLGGGLAPRIFKMHGIVCRSIEIDPAVVEIARHDFGFTGDATLGNARVVLGHEDSRYDLVFLDVCTADRLGWHLFTLEAMKIVRDRLSPDGILAIQFIGDDGPWSASLVRTVTTVFGWQNCVLLAPLPVSDPVGPRWLFVSRRAPLDLPSDLHLPSRARSWMQLDLPTDGLLLTDDHFPTELAWAAAARRWRNICNERR